MAGTAAASKSKASTTTHKRTKSAAGTEKKEKTKRAPTPYNAFMKTEIAVSCAAPTRPAKLHPLAPQFHPYSTPDLL